MPTRRLDALAVVSAEQGDMIHAARLIGAAASVRDIAGAVVYRYYLSDENAARLRRPLWARCTGEVVRTCRETEDAVQAINYGAALPLRAPSHHVALRCVLSRLAQLGQ